MGVTYQPETDTAHIILRQKVKRLLDFDCETDEDMDWFQSSIRDAYRLYGEQADKAR